MTINEQTFSLKALLTRLKSVYLRISFTCLQLHLRIYIRIREILGCERGGGIHE
jgi:hypothetical protein